MTRKQREIANRHSLFLDIARNLLHDEGFHQLSMDRVAERAEYSKGTVYQHFTCKEEMLIQLCIASTSQLLSLFQRAALFDGTHRDRMMAIMHAHDLWARLEPKNGCLLQLLCTDGVKSKVTQESLQQHLDIESQMMKTVTDVAAEAQAAGELGVPALTAGELVFGLWSLSYGGQLLCSYDIDFSHLGIAAPNTVLNRVCAAALDGLGWRPLFDETGHAALQVRLEEELFVEEYRQLTLNQGDHTEDTAHQAV